MLVRRSPMAMPSYGHEYAAVKLNDTTTYGNDDIFDDDEDFGPIYVPDAPRYTGRKVAAVLSICALAGASFEMRTRVGKKMKGNCVTLHEAEITCKLASRMSVRDRAVKLRPSH